MSIFAIGSNAYKLLELSMEYGISCEVCNTLDVAVEAIKKTRYTQDSYKECDVALLSPAAASLDQFSSYKERGDVFKQYALTLK